VQHLIDGLGQAIVWPAIHLVQANQSYKQPVQLFWNTGGRRTFEMVRAEDTGPELFQPLVGRGCTRPAW
jgi:enediyne biosynthesis protein E4